MDNTQDKTQQTLSLKNAILSTVTRSVPEPLCYRCWRRNPPSRVDSLEIRDSGSR
jgi:hypothetical protein